MCYCGDGRVDTSEQCDAVSLVLSIDILCLYSDAIRQGNQNGIEGSGCSKDCKKVPVCGDGVQEGDEECDKGKDNGACVFSPSHTHISHGSNM